MTDEDKLNKAKILVVDDEILLAEDLKNILIKMGYEVPEVAISGEEAIKQALESRPDLVLMDIMLKGAMNGIEAARWIRSRLGIGVIYLTAYSDNDTIERAKRTEPLGYLVKPYQERELKSIIEIALYKHKIELELEQDRERLYQKSIKDALTGLYNRLYMNETIERLMHNHDRNESHNIVAIMFDIDYFKKINDTYGHGAGDEVLKSVANVIMGSTRAGDLAVRYGGEEFIVFLSNCTEKDSLRIGEKVRKTVSRLKFEGALEEVKITISAGIALRHQKEQLSDFIERADRALYRAKDTGRDKVFLSDEEPMEEEKDIRVN